MKTKDLRAAVEKTAAFLFALCQLFLASAVYGQAEVVDPVPLGGSSHFENRKSAQPSNGSGGGASQMQNEMYFQLQALHQQVLELRGMLDEQAHELKKLKQQRLDDYLDLDRRISQSGKSAPPRATQSPGTQAPSGSPAPVDELAQYRGAMDRLLKQQDQDGAIAALNQYLLDFPRGRYAANAQYWLGEAFLVKNESEKARQWFARIIEEFPTHSKAPDAKFKLAKVYDMQGEKETARSLLEEVARSNSNAAGLAKDYLEKNF